MYLTPIESTVPVCVTCVSGLELTVFIYLKETAPQSVRKLLMTLRQPKLTYSGDDAGEIQPLVNDPMFFCNLVGNGHPPTQYEMVGFPQRHH